MATYLLVYEQNESNMVSMWREVIEVTTRKDGSLTIQAAKLAPPIDGGNHRSPRSKPTKNPRKVLQALKEADEWLDREGGVDEYADWFKTIYGPEKGEIMWKQATEPKPIEDPR